MKRFRLRKFYLSVVNVFVLLYLEVIFRLFTGISFSINFIYVFLFILIIGGLLNIVERIFNNKVNKCLFLIGLFLGGLIYSVQLCI